MRQTDTQFTKRWLGSLGITLAFLIGVALLPLNFSTQNNIDSLDTTDAKMIKDISLITIPKRQTINSSIKEIIASPKETAHAPKKNISNTETIPAITEPKQTEKIETEEIVEPEISKEEIVSEQVEPQVAKNYDTDTAAEQFTENTTTTTTSAANISAAANNVSKNTLTKYKQYAVSRIAGNKSYPIASRAKNEEGTVRVFVVIGRDGSLLEALITQECNFPTLNEAALRAVKKSAPFKKVGKEIDADTVSFECVMEFQIEI